jgi:2'-5' RNA ligase
MHVTLKYIGDWQGHRLEEVIRALNQVKQVAPLNVPLAGLGFYPNARSPRVFWAGAENTTALRQLASSIDSKLQPLGIPPEVRPYQPHLTLGRITESGPFPELDQAVEDLPSREFGTISPDRFVLFESTVTRSGPIYRKVAEFTFANQGKEPAVVAATRVMTAGTA